MDADDAVDVLEEVDEEIRKQLIELIDEESKEDIRLICSYEEDEIGSKMTTNFIEIGRSLTIKQAMRALIAQAEENDNISTLFVEDNDGTFYGAVDLKDLIVARTYMDLESLITQSFPYVRDHEPALAPALLNIFQDHPDKQRSPILSRRQECDREFYVPRN